MTAISNLIFVTKIFEKSKLKAKETLKTPVNAISRYCFKLKNFSLKFKHRTQRKNSRIWKYYLHLFPKRCKKIKACTGGRLDGHLGGGFLNFWPKWVINITKLGMQICSFWQNSRPLRPKMALIRGIIEIERAVFVLLALFWHMKRRCLGKAKSERTFLHTLLYSNTRKEDFWSRETSKSTHMSIFVFV